MKKLLTVLLALAMAFTMVFATAASAEDGYKDSITWVIGNDQDILDPQNNVSNSKVIPQYYDGLLGYDNDGNVVCKMAESYEASEDKMTWTFHLRQDVYFHSGRHCTAHDFEATFDRLLNTENPQRYTSNASFIDTAVATDDYTFVITLKEPKAFFLQAIAKQWAFVLNPEYIEKYGADLGKTAESVDGTGPFKCTQWDKGEVMKFEAFENYYEGAPLTHEIVMKIVPEQTSRAIAIETNQADIADGISPDDAVRLDALDGVTVSKTEGNGCHLFQFNCASTHAPMSIPAVRQAICYAIDRNAICEYLYSGLGETPIDSIMAPSVAGYASVGVVPYDPEKAKEMADLIYKVKGEGDTIGGTLTCVIKGCPIGLGQPVFGKLHAALGNAMLSINAAKAFEYGEGFKGLKMKGSEQNDVFFNNNGRIETHTNHSGGIQGGISNGQDIYFRVVFKPIATLLMEQETVNIDGVDTTLKARGRHDACVLPRAVPIVEAMAAMTILDYYLLDKTTQL